jgi:hypothetical protein
MIVAANPSSFAHGLSGKLITDTVSAGRLLGPV